MLRVIFHMRKCCPDLLPGASNADDILARLSGPASGEPLRLSDGSRDPLQLPKD